MLGGLKKYALVACGLLCLGMGVRSSGVGEDRPAYMTGSALSTAAEHQLVGFTGRLVDVHESRSGKPLWSIETADGYDVKVLIADDVKMPSRIELGSRYSVAAHVLSTGLVTAQARDAIRHLVDTRVVDAMPADVRVIGQWAYQAVGTGTRRFPAEPGGVRVVSIDGQLRLVP